MTVFRAAELALDASGNTLSLESPSASWRELTPSISTPDGEIAISALVVEDTAGTAEEGFEVRLAGTCDLARLRLRVAFGPDDPVALLSLELLAQQPFELQAVKLRGTLAGNFDRFWKQGWQSWSPAYVTALANPLEVASDPLVARFGIGVQGQTSFDVGLLGGAGSAICAGFLTADRFLGAVEVAADELSCSWLAGGLALDAGELVPLEALRLDLANDAEGALGRYAAAVAELAGTEPPKLAPSGWCSWYYYFTAVTEQDVLANLDFLASHRRQLPVELVQLDDGYQAAIGDWRDWNEKFPGGPRAITEQIHAAGLKAGLWLAPFLAGENSRLAAEHPDWLVRDRSGKPVVAVRNWGQANYALDLTNPAARDWLRALFVEIFDEWRFDYVKIDFVFAAAIPGRRFDDRRSPIEAYREGLAIVRRAAGERFVLGCGALQLASVGLVDAMRIGPDVAPWWRARGPRGDDGQPAALPAMNGAPAAEAAIRNTLQRSWSHGLLWLNDPDCLLARDSKTRLSGSEVQSLATVIGLSAGMIVLSDNLPELSQAALDTISFLLPALPAPAALRNRLGSDLPDRLELDSGERLVVALFNWEDEERDLILRLSEAEVFDVYGGRYLGVARRELVLPAAPAHGCRLLSLTPADGRPRVLGTSFHIGQGIHEIASETHDSSTSNLTLTVNPMPLRSGSIWVRWPFDTVEVTGAYDGIQLLEGVLRIDLTLDQPVQLIVRPEQIAAGNG
jgi:alpha-galactosidase